MEREYERIRDPVRRQKHKSWTVLFGVLDPARAAVMNAAMFDAMKYAVGNFFRNVFGSMVANTNFWPGCPK